MPMNDASGDVRKDLMRPAVMYTYSSVIPMKLMISVVMNQYLESVTPFFSRTRRTASAHPKKTVSLKACDIQPGTDIFRK